MEPRSKDARRIVRRANGLWKFFRMHGCYSSDELKSLVRILNDILAQARTRRPDLATDDIVERVFSLADRGERDARKLHQAVFGASDIRVPRRPARIADHGFAPKGDGHSDGLVSRSRKPTFVPIAARSFPDPF